KPARIFLNCYWATTVFTFRVTKNPNRWQCWPNCLPKKLVANAHKNWSRVSFYPHFQTPMPNTIFWRWGFLNPPIIQLFYGLLPSLSLLWPTIIYCRFLSLEILDKRSKCQYIALL